MTGRLLSALSLPKRATEPLVPPSRTSHELRIKSPVCQVPYKATQGLAPSCFSRSITLGLILRLRYTGLPQGPEPQEPPFVSVLLSVQTILGCLCSPPSPLGRTSFPLLSEVLPDRRCPRATSPAFGTALNPPPPVIYPNALLSLCGSLTRIPQPDHQLRAGGDPQHPGPAHSTHLALARLTEL